jgi:hypothetical protein
VHGERSVDGSGTRGVALVKDPFGAEGSDDRDELIELLLAGEVAVVVRWLEAASRREAPDLKEVLWIRGRGQLERLSRTERAEGRERIKDSQPA